MKTVQVRIAVAVDKNGAWAGSGYSRGKPKNAFDFLTDDLEPGEARYWVTAELQIPEPVDVAGKVERA